MPFPFAILGPIAGVIAGAAATVAATAGTIALTGAVVLGGLAITGAIIERNEKARDRAREDAEEIASYEREKELLKKKKKHEKKAKKLEEEYGGSVPQKEKEAYLENTSVLLGEFEGNKAGLVAKGLSASSEADEAEAELRALREKSGIKE